MGKKCIAMPAKAGIQWLHRSLDPRVRGNDGSPQARRLPLGDRVDLILASL